MTPPVASAGLDRTRVLLVESDPGDAELIQIWLRRAHANSYEIWHVESLGDAESCLAKQRFDLVLLDLSVPDAPGPWAFQSLHENHPDLPVIVFSSFNEAEPASRLLSEGAHDHLVKGQMSGDTLIRSMRHGIERGRLTRELRRAQNRAEEVDGVRAELVAELAHEFRTPLHTVLSMADLLLETELTREQEGYVRSFLRTSESLLARLDGLLGGQVPAARPRAAAPEGAAQPVESGSGSREPAPRHAPESNLSGRFSSGGSLRILVADDAPNLRERTSALLREAGHLADPAPNGRVAVEMFREGDYDAVLMDIQMPEMDGLEATRRLRELEAETGRDAVPILAVTGLQAPAEVSACLEAGCDDHLGKPVVREELLEALARHAPKHHQRLLRVDGATADEIDHYLHERHNDLAGLRFALEAEDLDSARAVGHELESSALRHGFAELVEIGRGLQRAAGAGDRAAVEAGASLLTEFLREVKIVVD